MNKKGFTLVELLAVIVILSLLALLTETAITKLVGDSKEELYDTQILLIKSSAESWAADNIEEVPLAGECIYLKLKDLKSFGFIDSSITNPKTNKEFSDELKIKISSTLSENNNLITKFEVNPENVDECHYIILEPGLYDSNDNLLATWNELTENYGVDIQEDVYSNDNYESLVEGSFSYILEQNDELINGVKLIISPSVSRIGYAAFVNCSTLESIIIPSSVTSIGALAFSGCSNLKGIIIPSSVIGFGSYVFSDCTNLENITISPGVKTISSGFCFNCTNLKSISIPSSVTYIDRYAFSGCSSLESITIPSSVTYIDDWVFKGCTSLKDITIPSNLTVIGMGTFNGCSNLKKVNIPEGVKNIKNSTFTDCTSLESITIPSSVTSIGESAFDSNLKTLYYSGSATGSPWGATSATIIK